MIGEARMAIVSPGFDACCTAASELNGADCEPSPDVEAAAETYQVDGAGVAAGAGESPPPQAAGNADAARSENIAVKRMRAAAGGERVESMQFSIVIGS